MMAVSEDPELTSSRGHLSAVNIGMHIYIKNSIIKKTKKK